MNKTLIPLAIIQVLTKDRKIPHDFNRFWCPQTHTDHRNSLDLLLKSASCQTGAWENACKVQSNVQSSPGRKRFVLVHFEPGGIKQAEILHSFKDACIRPATLEEMLTLTAQYLTSRGNTTVIALGSSNIQSKELSRASQGFWYRKLVTQKMHACWQKSAEVFPLIEWKSSYSHLRLTKGVGGWRSDCTFLGVVQNRDFDTCLVDLRISTEEYLALPSQDFYPNLKHVPFGTRYLADTGYICEVVRHSEVLKKQKAHINTPSSKIGLRYYRPVFTDI